MHILYIIQGLRPAKYTGKFYLIGVNWSTAVSIYTTLFFTLNVCYVYTQLLAEVDGTPVEEWMLKQLRFVSKGKDEHHIKFQVKITDTFSTKMEFHLYNPDVRKLCVNFFVLKLYTYDMLYQFHRQNYLRHKCQIYVFMFQRQTCFKWNDLPCKKKN